MERVRSASFSLLVLLSFPHNCSVLKGIWPICQFLVPSLFFSRSHVIVLCTKERVRSASFSVFVLLSFPRNCPVHKGKSSICQIVHPCSSLVPVCPVLKGKRSICQFLAPSLFFSRSHMPCSQRKEFLSPAFSALFFMFFSFFFCLFSFLFNSFLFFFFFLLLFLSVWLAGL